jgi:D-glutamate cyclase
MTNGWYFDYLDRIANLEFKNNPAAQGSTELRYRVARQVQGETAICGQIAEALLPRLADSTVILVTGTGNPVWLPNGETDGPSGVAVLARVLAALGVRTCVLSEKRFLPGIAASVQAAGVPLLEEAAWRQRSNAALALEFPTGPEDGQVFVDSLMDRLPGISSVFFIEKPGPNIRGVFHNSSGKPKDSGWVAHAQLLAEAATQRKLLTVAVGDGGNEIGFGRIRSQLTDLHPYGNDCGCPCHAGLLDNTEVDFLLPASVSNWGGYAIGCALALQSRRFTLMPAWDDVQRSIQAPITCGAFDGYSGLAVASVDGTSPAANHAIYQLMLEVLRLAEAQTHP